jgi:hypothetical protein
MSLELSGGKRLARRVCLQQPPHGVNHQNFALIDRHWNAAMAAEFKSPGTSQGQWSSGSGYFSVSINCGLPNSQNQLTTVSPTNLPLGPVAQAAGSRVGMAARLRARPRCGDGCCGECLALDMIPLSLCRWRGLPRGLDRMGERWFWSCRWRSMHSMRGGFFPVVEGPCKVDLQRVEIG